MPVKKEFEAKSHAKRDFKINSYITLKLEDGKTNIYVQDRLFSQCKFLLINIPSCRIDDFDDIGSVDEAAEGLNKEMENHKSLVNLEDEFWGHCSNIQAWAEMKYDTRLLHRNLAFPLLKKLTEIGDQNAKHRFKEEIVKRALSGNKSVLEYLSKGKYFEYLNDQEFSTFLADLCERDYLTISLAVNKGFTQREKFSNIIMKEEIIKNTLTMKEARLSYLSDYMKEKDLFSIARKVSLQKLSLKHKNLNELPESIGELVSLRYLDLSNNKLDRLPESIGELVSLRYLDLSNNKLDRLPKSIGKLASLVDLNLSNNKLDRLPKSIGKLASLADLDLGSNRFVTLPRSIGELTSLQYLDLSENKFISLPEPIGKLTYLRSLYLNHSSLEEIPLIGRLTSLECLDLTGNKLRQLPESIGNLIFLEELNLRFNPLTKLPHSLINLEHLHSLRIDSQLTKLVPKLVKKRISTDLD